MKNSHFSLLLCLALTVVPSLALAEKADRNKAMNIEADALRYDGLKQVNIYSGAVTLTKGSIQIRGAQLEVRQDPEGFQFGIVTGSAATPAFFRQKLEGVDEFIEGEGEVIEYDGRADTVRFVRKAQWRRLRGALLADEVMGGLIVYSNLTDTLTVDGSNVSKPTGSAPGGRVRAMLTPKPEAATAPAAPPATLRPATALGGAKK